jgi:hypothetical protein
MADTEALGILDAAFGPCPRPEHFTNDKHCEECAEHDELLRNRDRDTLTVADVGNPSWDPICFITGRLLKLSTDLEFGLVMAKC